MAILDNRITNAYITCIGMLCRHVLCLLHTVQVWSRVYCCRATPNAYFQINEHLHTFFFLQPLLGMLGTQTIYYMKTRNLLFAASLLAFGVASCERVIEALVTPDDEAKTYTIKLRAGGEVDVTHEPLTRFIPDDRDLYGVQVWHKPATTGSYEYYAYGLFDNLEDVELEVTENYKYKLEVNLIDDGKDKIYCDSILVDSKHYLGYGQPFKGRNKYNASSTTSITQLTNAFTYDSDRYFNDNDYIQTTDGKERHYPEGIDFYYGAVTGYLPTEDGATLSIYLKHMIFGLKVNIGDYFDNGVITLSLPHYMDYQTFTFTPENRTLETTFANTEDAPSWYGYEDISHADTDPMDVDFRWTKDDGSIVDWKSFIVYFYRLKQTVINLEYYGEDGVLGDNSFDIHYEDTEIENDYKSYNFGSEQEDYYW